MTHAISAAQRGQGDDVLLSHLDFFFFLSLCVQVGRVTVIYRRSGGGGGG